MFHLCPSDNFSYDESETVGELVARSLAYCAFWAACFYTCLHVLAPYLHKLLPPSSNEIENSPIWIAWNGYTLLQSLVIPLVCFAALFSESPNLWEESDRNKFSNHHWVAEAGLAFTCFEITDLCIMFRHDFLPRAFIVHHAVYISLGVFIRSDCCFCYHAAVLMAQVSSANASANAPAVTRQRQAR
jgi:hypothetical protein